jgi:hypothetical protein
VEPPGRGQIAALPGAHQEKHADGAVGTVRSAKLDRARRRAGAVWRPTNWFDRLSPWTSRLLGCCDLGLW